jgi:polyisoprenoid-binding protein YceI
MANRLAWTVGLVVAMATWSAIPRAATATYRIDPSTSRFTIHVGKAGAFSFLAGHTHEVSGPIQSGSVDLDVDDVSSGGVRLAIAASDLKVSAEGEPEGDAPKVQAMMDSEKVLDVTRYPKLAYQSTTVALEHRRGDVLDLTTSGRLTIRDVTREVAAPVHVQLNGNALVATGRLRIKQSSYGIKPVSVGGVVAVKDELEIEFSISAKR